ncbi:MAG: Fis family transcriptional regulator [Clostridia bacterium]|jgi:transcriptional regulator with PAS, ATPase and Fis domain|nr:Fis family transcriptional regulator [Clostridia bacterium]
MSNNKKITLLTGTESTKTELLDQLQSLLHGYVDIESYASDSGLEGIIKSDLIVISSKLILDEVMPFIDKNCPMVLARRALNISNIDKLFSIPEGTKALLVNDTPETACEVIGLLKELGIDHIDFIPHFPNCEADRQVVLAITPGESELVPDFIEKTIDIGPRIIDLTTIVEILEKLNILDEKAHFVSAKYMETIVSLGKQLYKSINESNKINDYLIKVLNQVNDGIIAFNKDGKITVFNQKSEEIFKLNHNYTLGKNIAHIIKDKALLEYLLSKEAIPDQLFRINENEVAISRFTVKKLNSIVCTIKNTKEIAEIENKLRRNLIKRGHIAKYRFSDIIGSSQTLKNTIITAEKIAKSDLSILIHGESGTGKELFASAIHNASPRGTGPFLAVNFSALSEDLVESELFGYEEGAFTGAKKGGKLGIFEQANNGTIFLDEIGDTSLKIQARLLRVLQEKEIMRVGGTEIIHVNVRIIAATNKDLVKMYHEGKFREDLYYRLKRLYLKTPPLRSRLEDIDELVRYFLAKNHRPDLVISNEVRNILTTHNWPGNIRELESTIEYMVAVCDESTINRDCLPQDFFNSMTTSSFDNIAEKLSTKGALSEFLFIMRTLYEYNSLGKSIGRKKISALTQNFDYFMTEEQIRKRTDILMDLDLLVKTRGRTGMLLSMRGKNYIEDQLY